MRLGLDAGTWGSGPGICTCLNIHLTNCMVSVTLPGSALWGEVRFSASQIKTKPKIAHQAPPSHDQVVCLASIGYGYLENKDKQDVHVLGVAKPDSDPETVGVKSDWNGGKGSQFTTPQSMFFP